MATITESDLVQFASAEETAAGVAIVRGFLVTGLSGASAVVDAMAAGPAYGDVHPADSGLVVVKKQIKPRLNSKTEMVLIVTYGPPEMIVLPTPVVRVRATTRGVRTNYDRDRNIIKVKFTDSLGKTHSETVGQVDGQEAFGVLDAAWIEPTNPENWLMPYINTINSRAWRGWPKYTWWCRDIQIEKEVYRPGYKCSVVIEFDPRTYVKTVAVRVNGMIPKALGDAPFDGSVGQHNGYTNVLIAAEADFGGLHIP